MNRYQALLREYWGYDDFRGIQRQIIDSITSGNDTLGLMPTGGGKSITFQVPALAADGLCIVITPLIALMRDQVEHLRRRGIKAAYINSTMHHDEILTTLDNAVFGAYKLLYISPERIGSELFQTKLTHMHVSFICVDEAHCISQWGYDFRPSYLNIRAMRKLLPQAPILALTATAPPSVIDDIQQQLEFRHPNVFRMSFERKNLAYIVIHEHNKHERLQHLLADSTDSTIIYCRNRENCRKLAEVIDQWGHTVTFYHAGLSSTEKNKRQTAWQKDNIRIMVATNAFGMGIDKPNVRQVIHMDIPDSIEAYFQEAGRAGRDGEPAKAILLYDQPDLRTLRNHVTDTFPPIDTIKQIYEEVCCYLHIATGFGQGIRREFNLEQFSVNFHHFPNLVVSCLRILTLAGYIQYEDAEEGISRLTFYLKRDELYRLDHHDREKDNILRTILRHYLGLFVNLVPIDEEFIANETGLTPVQVYHHLKELDARHVLKYIPKKNIPHITFTCERRDITHLSIPAPVYADRRERLQNRIDQIFNYVTSNDTCRNRLLLAYFGEKINTDCQQCDICLLTQAKDNQEQLLPSKKVEKVSEESSLSSSSTLSSSISFTTPDAIRNEIRRQLSEAGSLMPYDLNFDYCDLDLARQVLRDMTDRREIITDSFFHLHLAE